MTSQELQKLREQITASTILSQIERTEWIQLLPEMNDAQAAELASILQSATEHVRKPSVLTPPPQHPASLSEEKDLPVGVHLAALESGIAGDLPEHATTPAPTPPAKTVVAQPIEVKPAIVSPPVQPVQPVTPVVRQPVPQPQPQPQPAAHGRPEWQKAMTHELNPHEASLLHAASAEHAHPVLTQNIQKPADLERLDMTFLRQGDPKIVLDNLIDAVTAMAKQYPVTEIAGKVETSPLYKAYYASGISALNSGALAAGADPDSLTKEEFEAFTDFRVQMDHIIS